MEPKTDRFSVLSSIKKKIVFLIELSLLLEGLFGAVILENERLVEAIRSFSQNHLLAFGQDFRCKLCAKGLAK